MRKTCEEHGGLKVKFEKVRFLLPRDAVCKIFNELIVSLDAH
jgi:hypothetical protein